MDGIVRAFVHIVFGGETSLLPKCGEEVERHDKSQQVVWQTRNAPALYNIDASYSAGNALSYTSNGRSDCSLSHL